MDPKTFCIVPWTQVRINPDGTLRPCCKINLGFPTKNINTCSNIDEWWNGDDIKNLRRDLTSGVKHSACNTCWHDEAAGKKSLREEYNKNFSKFADLKHIAKSTDWTQPELPILLDLNLGNICNFKCVMCVPELSSRIHTEQKQHKEQFKALSFFNYKDKSLDFSWPEQEKFTEFMQQAKDNVRMIEFKGGEPLLIANVIETIKNVPNKEEVIISVTTNGSVDIEDDFLSELSKFKHVWMFVSVDGIGDLNEYVRFGSRWSQVDQNIKKLATLENCTFRVSTVLQFFSSLTFPAISDYIQQHGYDIEFQYCHNPKYLSLDAILPTHMEQFKAWTQAQIEKNPHREYLQVLMGYLDQYQFDPELHNQCRQYLDTLDAIRRNANNEIQQLYTP